MRTDDRALVAQTHHERLSASLVARALVAAAMCASSIVLFEPAPADALMLVVIVAVPILGAARFGRAATINTALWLGIVGLGIAAATMASPMASAVKHQLVTLFLALGAFVVAGFVSLDPEPRFRLVMRWYVVACLIATAAALAGYFDLVPRGHDLFTLYDRARGTFKDPNVYGAALVPALLYCVWVMLRRPRRQALAAAAAALLFCIGLLLSFSRGAWASAAFGLVILAWLAFITGRRKADSWRLALIGCLGSLALASALAVALQSEAVQALIEERDILSSWYDADPEGRFGGQAKAVALILDNPFGIGTYTFRALNHGEEPHNVYLTIFLNAGWLGGFLYIITLGATLLIGIRGALRRDALQGPFVIATAALAAAAFEGLVIDSEHWRHFFILLGLIWGLADAAAPPPDRSHRRFDPVSWARGWTPPAFLRQRSWSSVRNHAASAQKR